MPSLIAPPLHASINPLLAPPAHAPLKGTPSVPALSAGPVPAHAASSLSSGRRHSMFDLFLQILDGLLTPEPRPPQACPSAGARRRMAIESLDVPAYLRRGVRIPELD